MEDRRITRLNELTWGMYQEYPYGTTDREEIIEDAERAICRAAAEISGLTAQMMNDANDFLAADLQTGGTAPINIALRRYAELAAADE